MLKPLEQVAAEDAAFGRTRPYWDPALTNNRRKKMQLMHALLDLGLVRVMPLGSCKEEAGLFLVKKPGKTHSRFIVDARRANRLFVAPPGLSMCTAETFARLEVAAERVAAPAPSSSADAAALGLCDVRDAFHRFRIAPELSAYFGLGQATAKDLHLSDRPGGELMELAWASLPMGFSWSLFFCQRAGETALDETLVHPLNGTLGQKVPTRLGDRSTSCQLDPGVRGVQAFYVYVDNVGLLGYGPREVSESLESVTAALASRGLPTHEEATHSLTAKALGVQLDLQSGRAVLTPGRLWRVRQGIRGALRHGRATGKVWEIMIGHLSYCGLLDRGSLSCLRSIYANIRKNYDVHAPLWEEAAKEVRHMTSLLPLLAGEWHRPWLADVLCTDASETGSAQLLANGRWKK